MEQNGHNLKLAPHFFEYEGQSNYNEVDHGVYHFILTKVIEIANCGGIGREYKDCKYPMKGFPFFEAMYAMDIVKKNTLVFIKTLAHRGMVLPILAFAILPRKTKLGVINQSLEAYKRIGDYSMMGIYLKHRYYSPCPKALWSFVNTFLTEIGIRKDLAEGVGKIVATMIEYDDAYRYRFEDAMSEFTYEEWYRNPRKSALKFANIFEERDKQVGEKFVKLAKLLRFIFIIPSIKKAFRKALTVCNFKDLQLDDADRYHCHLRTGYNFFGMEDEERINKWVEIHNGKIPEQILIKTV